MRCVPTRILIARHAKAKPRSNWAAAEDDRPLAATGNVRRWLLAASLCGVGSEPYYCFSVVALRGQTVTRIRWITCFGEGEEVPVRGWRSASPGARCPYRGVAIR